MHEARPYASLSSGLLARKGSAKPAMRPQGYTGGFDDLGWNDMGGALDHDAAPPPPAEHVPSSISALTPLPRTDGDEHSIVAQQRALAETFDEDVAEEIADEIAPAPVVERVPAEVVTMPKRSATVAAKKPIAVEAAAGGKKAAFTLRLDAERHLKLRLACAVTTRSAQQLVAGALDEFLATIPEIDALAARVPGKRR